MPDIPRISKREWLVMTKLWERYPQTAAEVVEKIQAEIKIGDSSIRTLLNRLVKKNAVGYTVDAGNANLYYYHPLVCEQDCIQEETRNFMELYYQNNIAKFFAAFMDDSEVSAEEIERLRTMLDEKAGEQL